MVGATVTVTETWNGTTKTLTATTSTSGVASFMWQKAQPGTYTATVTTLSAGVSVWDTSKGVTSATYTFL